MAVIWPEYHLEEDFEDPLTGAPPAYSDHRRHPRRLPSAEPPLDYMRRNRSHDGSVEESSDDFHRVPSRQAPSFHSGPPPSYDGGHEQYLARALEAHQNVSTLIRAEFAS